MKKALQTSLIVVLSVAVVLIYMWINMNDWMYPILGCIGWGWQYTSWTLNRFNQVFVVDTLLVGGTGAVFMFLISLTGVATLLVYATPIVALGATICAVGIWRKLQKDRQIHCCVCGQIIDPDPSFFIHGQWYCNTEACAKHCLDPRPMEWLS